MEWRYIPGYDKMYLINEFGQVYSKYKNKLLKNNISPSRGYARVNLKINNISKTREIHRLVVLAFIDNLSECFIVDHIDGNKLNNNLTNLRITDYYGNARSSRKTKKITSSVYKGVYLHKCGKWCAQLTYNKKVIYLGLFENEINAAIAYNNAALIYYGEFAVLNELIK
jgi:hypothetical protein